jgi:glycosyltransferase involved in cell wall biosynthesis
MIKVCYFYRTPGYGFSIERVFEDVRKGVGHAVSQHETFCPLRSIAPLALLKNIYHCRKQRCSVNHITGDAYYLAIGLPREGLVVTVHDCGHIPNLSGFKRWFYRYFWFELATHRAEVVTFISKFSLSELESALGREIPNSVVIPDPVSDAFQPQPKAPNRRTPVILALGTKPNKNLVRLAAALKGMDVQLRIIGALPPDQKQALEQNHINYTAEAGLSFQQVVEEYAKADIVSLVSTHEGFGLPIVEAQATGRPVVTSNACSMPEVAGGAAVLVDPLSVESIREGFKSLLVENDCWKDCVALGLKNAERFRIPVIAQQFLEVYRRVDPARVP